MIPAKYTVRVPDVDEEQQVEPAQRDGVDGSEVAGNGGLGVQELRPGDSGACGCGIHSGALEDLPHGGRSEAVAGAGEFAVDATISPGRILPLRDAVRVGEARLPLMVGQFHRSVHGSGHDDRCQLKHRPMEVPACQAYRWPLHEREEISRALMADPMASWAAVARRVGRHPSTIAREVDRGGGRGRYGPATAQRRAERASRRPRRRLLAVRGALRERIATELRLGRSPVAIWSDLVAEDAPGRPCVETIYQAIYDGALGVRPSECLRSRRRRRRPRDNAAGQRGARRRRTSSRRPDAVNDRREGGHWGRRPDHRRQQPLVDDLAHRTPKPLPDTGHHARRLHRRRRPRRPHRRLRHHPRPAAPQRDIRSKAPNGPTGAPPPPTTASTCGSATPTRRANAARSRTSTAKRAGGSPAAPTSASSPSPQAEHAANIINNQRRRSLNYRTPAELYAALTVH